MKISITVLFIAVVSSFSLNATVLTVSNHPAGGAQYATLESAYNAASPGDTLYVEPTSITYFTQIAFDKQLTVVGAGFNADLPHGKKTIVSSASPFGDFHIEANASGSVFLGLIFSRAVGINMTVSSMTFESCLFESYVSMGDNASQLTLRNCIFNENNTINLYLPNSAAGTLVASNCVFDGWIDGSNNSVNTVLIDHCVFLSPSDPIYRIQNATISNSIFMNCTGMVNSSTLNTFVNNISRLTSMPPAGNSGLGNQGNTDPQFVSYTFNEYYSTSHDYDLQAGSTGINAGGDGTDIGVHGGSTMFSEAGEVLSTPYVRSVIVKNSSVAPGGTLNVEVNASRPAVD